MGGDWDNDGVPLADREHPASDISWTAGAADVARDFSWSPSDGHGASPIHPIVTHIRTLAIATVVLTVISGGVLIAPTVTAVFDDGVPGKRADNSVASPTTNSGLSDDTETDTANAASLATPTPSTAESLTDTRSPTTSEAAPSTRTDVTTISATPSSTPKPRLVNDGGGDSVEDDDDEATTATPTPEPTPTMSPTEVPTSPDDPTEKPPTESPTSEPPTDSPVEDPPTETDCNNPLCLLVD